MDANLINLLPYGIMAVLGFLAKAMYNNFNSSLKELNMTITQLNTTISRLGERVSHLEGKVN